MNRAYYSKPVMEFLKESEDSVLGTLTRHHEFSLVEQQRNAWIHQIRLLRSMPKSMHDGHLLFEFSIPRMGKRVDVVLLLCGIVFVLEFKVGETEFGSSAVTQVLDYCLDLKNFHSASHEKQIVGMVVASKAPKVDNHLTRWEDLVYLPIKCNDESLFNCIGNACRNLTQALPIVAAKWETAIYKPTPTIIEAAQALYRGHSVREISRSDADAINLSVTSEAISKVIDVSKKNDQKAICFITGVPGSGKTLAGLNIANERHQVDEGEHAVFLSGNGPLVMVLQEALARNEIAVSIESQSRIRKTSALSKTKAFIQNIHHFRDDALRTSLAPIERVVVFDEAQRAWTLEQTSSFMKRKKGIADFNQSEPRFLIGVMDRRKGWSVIICLIGGGQEINTGEAGLPEWFSSIESHFPDWNVYVSDKLVDHEYTRGCDLLAMIQPERLWVKREFHLSTSIRSYRSEKVSKLIKKLLDCQQGEAGALCRVVQESYPLVVSRNLEKAKDWLRSKARGTERYGIVASSGAHRLKPNGIHVKDKIDPIHWFLDREDDVRSSYSLEDAATEFEIQGLELDWTCVAWGADLRHNGTDWEYKRFRGTSWQNVNDVLGRLYLKNAYRVLLTRARQGMVIFVPEGDDSDVTRKCSFYDTTFEYLESLGLLIIE